MRQRPAQEARGEQAGAIHRPPQGPPGYPSPGLHRSTTARRHRGAGSDALPTDGMGRSLARVPAMMAGDAVYFERRKKSLGWWDGICWQSADCEHPVSSLFAQRMERGSIRRMVEGGGACGRRPSTLLRLYEASDGPPPHLRWGGDGGGTNPGGGRQPRIAETRPHFGGGLSEPGASACAMFRSTTRSRSADKNWLTTLV
jgi:hypothetical protein